MNTGAKIWEKISDPGFVLLLLGALVTYASSLLVRDVKDDAKREKANLVVKAVGCAVALLGAFVLFT